MNDSPRGLTAELLSTELGARVQSSLRDLTGRGVVVRERMGRGFVYFSGDPVRGSRQREEYVAAWRHEERGASAAGLPDKDIDIISFLQKLPGNMAPDKTGGACDQNPQISSSP